MIALDTNVLVRVVTNDDPAQARRALARMRANTCWVTRTVLLETEWVLRHAYGLAPAAIGQAFSTLLGIEGVEVEDRGGVLRALAWHAGGMDFADALHLAASGEASELITFDRDFARVARRVGAAPRVVAP